MEASCEFNHVSNASAFYLIFLQFVITCTYCLYCLFILKPAFKYSILKPDLFIYIAVTLRIRHCPHSRAYGCSYVFCTNHLFFLCAPNVSFPYLLYVLLCFTLFQISLLAVYQCVIYHFFFGVQDSQCFRNSSPKKVVLSDSDFFFVYHGRCHLRAFAVGIPAYW